ncbi:E3 ubiquitin-protein ligase MARCHF6 isoform X1 [Schistocerca serialis cubense]|uniref:E3 ubiquitin-protein ligase MARCHF6 isoform X1 n=1 Tax=Schistocerca serialis cubense TaxID=2023355 RepID=UPI00214F5C70|nr:E3 ubiquitin-protein ligase MARCHF6 isoform X1 [Schistocerca serialis cubense]
MMEDLQGADICRVCRSEGSPERPLFHPCICTGSIKWIHQECLVQWMRYSRKEYCELCGHRFSFTPIYSPDMPRRLPLRDVAGGLLTSIATAVKYWLHYTLVAVAWLGVVPLTACRIYRCLFTGSVDSILTLPLDMLSTENIASDVFHGCFVVTCTLFAFIGLVWLREQILHGGGPDWLERDNHPQPLADAPAPPANPPHHPDNNNVLHGGGPDWLERDNNPPAVADAPAAPANPPQPPDNNDVLEQEALPMVIGAFLGGGGGGGGVPPPPVAGAELGAFLGGGVPPPPVAGAELEAPADVLENGGAEGDEQGANQGADEGNWNPIEWDRAAEELTWEKLLGFDGSLAFLEHVFWVVSLNTLFILVFAFCPYHIGHFAVMGFGLQQHATASRFEGLVTTLCGYVMIGLGLVVLRTIASLLGLRRSKRILGLCYVVVKVSLLSVVEIGVLPLICGWWLDICSLSMFDATLRDRETSFQMAPGTSMFIHWLVGMVYVYYFASFILLLREVLRPGVLWFLRNLNDPDFSPIQEMIHLPILRHVRRLLASAVIFGTAVLLMLWLPVRILRAVWPSFLPYTVALQTETQVNELSLELLLLQVAVCLQTVILPALLEQSQTRTWLKALVRAWCCAVAWLLDLRPYLLGDERDRTPAGGQQQQQPQPAGEQVPLPAALAGGGLGAAHQALLQRDAPSGFQPYERPRWFAARLVGLLACVCVTLVAASLVALTVPVWLGREVTAMCLPQQPPGVSASPITATRPGTNGTARVHELYTAAAGTYLCWLVARAIALALSWLPQGRAAILSCLRQWCIYGARAVAACSILLGLVPLLFGLLLELVVVVPLRVPLDQTPVLFVWQDWALGVLYTKIACAIIMMGPEWHVRRAIERTYRDGIRDMNLGFVMRELAAPIISCLGLALAVPYVVAHGLVPLFVANPQLRNLIARRLYPFLLLVSLTAGIIVFQIRQFRKLYEHIKNDKYLVGRRLVNYDHRRHKSPSIRH